MERRRNSALETLEVMGGDIKEKATGLPRKTYDELREVGKSIKEDIRGLPRGIYNFTDGFARGLVFQQAYFSLGPYTNGLREWNKKNKNIGGEMLGLFSGAAVDAAIILGTIHYLCGDHNAYTKAAAIVAGTKVVSNLASKTIKWALSARQRVSE